VIHFSQRILSKQFIFYFVNCSLSNRILVAIFDLYPISIASL